MSDQRFDLGGRPEAQSLTHDLLVLEDCFEPVDVVFFEEVAALVVLGGKKLSAEYRRRASEDCQLTQSTSSMWSSPSLSLSLISLLSSWRSCVEQRGRESESIGLPREGEPHLFAVVDTFLLVVVTILIHVDPLAL